MARLCISSLGTLQMSLGDIPLTGFSCDKAKALLLYLVMEADRAHRRGHIVGLLWPDYPERHARHTLSQVLYNVRQVIGDRGDNPAAPQGPFVDVTRDTLQFQRASDYWLDAEVLTKPPGSPDLNDISASLDTLERAIALYRGPFLEGFSLVDSPAFEEWALLQRERLERTAMELLATLVRAHTEQHAYDRALHYAHQELALDPWRESTHRDVMRLLALNGQRGAALAQYEACCRVLRTQLHAAPDAETVALAGRVRSGALAPPAPRPQVIRANRSALPHNLPASFTPFVGRSAELAALRRYLQDPDCRLVTLTGPGGIGKSRLAIEAARQQMAGIPATGMPARFPDGIFLVPLTALESAEALAPAIAHALEITFAEKAGSPASQLCTHLRNKTLLLLLDGAEHLRVKEGIDSGGWTSAPSGMTALLNALLAAAPGLKILVTSRVQLGMLGEQLMPVSELPYPHDRLTEMQDLAQLAAVQLFVRSAQRVQPAFELHAGNTAAVADICRCLQGHPLALVLAATWAGTLSPAEIVAALAPDIPLAGAEGRAILGLDVLQADLANLPARHRSLRAVFEHSWQLLAPEDQQRLGALAVFRGSFSVALAQAATGATLRDLRTLERASLISSPRLGRYAFHDLFRQYALERLDADPAAARQIRDRYCAAYATALQAWADASHGGEQQQALTEMDMEIDNARAAWDWAVAQGDLTILDRAIDGLCLYYARRVRPTEGDEACRMAVARLEAYAATGHEEVQRVQLLAKVLRWRSQFMQETRMLPTAQHSIAFPDSHEQAMPLARQSLALLEAPELAGCDVRRARAATLYQLATLAMGFDREEALQRYKESLALWRALGETREEARVLSALGWWAWHSGNNVAARAYHEACLALARPLGDLRTISDGLMGRSAVDMLEGYFHEAERLSEEVLALRRQLGDPLDIAEALYSLAFKRLMLGRFTEALALLDETSRIYQESLGLPYPLATAVAGWARMFMGEYSKARALTERALQMMLQAKNRRGLGFVRQILGSIALAEGALDAAETLLLASAEDYRALQQWSELTIPLGVLAFLRCRQARLAQARAYVIEVLRIGCEICGHAGYGWGTQGAAMLAAVEGDPERALELYAMRRCCPIFEHSRWFEDVAGSVIREAAARLPPESAAAAQARGRARCPNDTAEELLVALRTVVGRNSP